MSTGFEIQLLALPLIMHRVAQLISPNMFVYKKILQSLTFLTHRIILKVKLR